jgi:hypothetical protein
MYPRLGKGGPLQRSALPLLIRVNYARTPAPLLWDYFLRALDGRGEASRHSRSKAALVFLQRCVLCVSASLRLCVGVYPFGRQSRTRTLNASSHTRRN